MSTGHPQETFGCALRKASLAASGAHLSHAARLAFAAQRAHLACLLHLEAADADSSPICASIARLLVLDARLTQATQELAEEYGRRCAEYHRSSSSIP